MSAPWMKFYPSDWRADPALRMCSMAARGLWIELLCIMHEADPRGHLLINGKPVKPAQIAVLASLREKEVAALLAELEGAGVFSRTSDGIIYSRRMVRDEETAARDKANGKRGGNPNIKPKLNGPVNPGGNGGVNPPDNGGLKAQKPEARSQSKGEASLKGIASPVSSGGSEPEQEKVEPLAARADAGFCLDGKPALPAAGEPKTRSTVAAKPPPMPPPARLQPSTLDLEIETLAWARKEGRLTPAEFDQAVEEARRAARH